jgi:hypothetical protein
MTAVSDRQLLSQEVETRERVRVGDVATTKHLLSFYMYAKLRRHLIDNIRPSGGVVNASASNSHDIGS